MCTKRAISILTALVVSAVLMNAANAQSFDMRSGGYQPSSGYRPGLVKVLPTATAQRHMPQAARPPMPLSNADKIAITRSLLQEIRAASASNPSIVKVLPARFGGVVLPQNNAFSAIRPIIPGLGFIDFANVVWIAFENNLVGVGGTSNMDNGLIVVLDTTPGRTYLVDVSVDDLTGSPMSTGSTMNVSMAGDQPGSLMGWGATMTLPVTNGHLLIPFSAPGTSCNVYAYNSNQWIFASATIDVVQ
jgi:hypothetical protein